MKRIGAIAFVCLFGPLALAQNARIHGLVEDPSKAVVVNATVTLANVQTGKTSTLKSNSTGAFVFASVSPGYYSLSGEAPGFDKSIVKDMKVEVDGDVTQDITLKVKRGLQTITVTSADSQLTESGGAVSTVIDHTFIEEMPLNGNSLSTLFELTPGVVTNASGGNQAQGGGLSINGQRGTSNYLTVDGASENVYIPPAVGPGSANVTGQGVPVSASGGTNGLLPTDAVEEYRIQTSTYSAEYGRTPGGQIGIRTRGGTNEFHGSVFENFRNQAMDATDYFIKFLNETQKPLRMNDFGGTLGGPALKNKLFFFIAHESLLMDQPQTGRKVDVPSSCAIQNAATVFQPFLAAYPIGNAGPDTTTALCNPGQPESSANQPISDIFNASFSNRIKDHSTSIRLDANLPWRSRAFIRVNDAPSSEYVANWNPDVTAFRTWTTSAGITSEITPRIVNDATINYSLNKSQIGQYLASYGGNSPSTFTNAAGSVENLATDEFAFYTSVWSIGVADVGVNQYTSIKQWNGIDRASWTLGRHSIKAGVDYLWRNPVIKQFSLFIEPYIGSFSSIQSGTIDTLLYDQYYSNPDIKVTNLSFFANDTWRISKALTLNYGLRWDINPSPSASGPGLFAIRGDITNPSSITEAPAGSPLFQTKFTNFAPRFGFAYALRDDPRFGTVVRGGAGIFYDTGTAATAAQAAQEGYPYKSNGSLTSVPYSSVNWGGLSSSAPSLPQGFLYITDPNLLAPRTYQWSLTVEQKLGSNSTLSTSYVGNSGQKLASTVQYSSSAPGYILPDPFENPLLAEYGVFNILTNGASSNYQSLQMQLRSRIASRLDAIASWTWSHNTTAGDSDFNGPQSIAQFSGHANSDNDIRHIFSTAIHYSPQGFQNERFLKSLTGGWALDTIALLQTASPLSVGALPSYPDSADYLEYNELADVNPNVPTVIHDSTAPGGRRLNPAAFSVPTCGACNGNSAQNGYRLFGLAQWDLAASRSWRLWEKAAFNFRVDAFNILNMANFADVNTYYSSYTLNTFGEAQNTYAGQYGGVQGALNTVFQNGGARSIQLSANIRF
jgi:hypothetical protein